MLIVDVSVSKSQKIFKWIACSNQFGWLYLLNSAFITAKNRIVKITKLLVSAVARI